MYVIVAKWQAKPGAGDEVSALLQEMMAHVQDEPGCAFYTCNRDPADQDRFLLYEQYLNDAAFQDHLATEPFQRIVLGQIVPLLIDRQREVWATID